MRLAPILIFYLLLFQPLAVSQEINFSALFPNTKINCYELKGSSIEELKRELFGIGPVDVHGIKRFALFSWTVKWNWPNKKDGKPDFSRAYVRGEYALKLPCVVPSEKLPPNERHPWSVFYTSLVAHEVGHYILVEQRMHGIKSKIEEAAKANPNLSNSDANDIAQQALEEIRKIDRKYDQETGNGKTQGVVL